VSALGTDGGVAEVQPGLRTSFFTGESLTTTYNRRGFLGRSLVVAGGIAGAGTFAEFLAACGSSSSSSSSSPSTAATASKVSIQLSWIKNVEFAGSYIADNKGYYKAQGITADLVSGGPTATIEPNVESGKVLIGINSPSSTSEAVAKGADLKIIATMYQKSPFAIMSLAKSPLKTPQDMIGKKIGVQAANESIWQAFLKANSIDASKITKVPAQFDPTPLANGQVDGWFSFVTNEPNLLKVKGIDTFTFLLNDFKYPSITNTYFVRSDTLTDKAKRASVVKFMRAEIKGWQDNIKDPKTGADLTANNYGKALKLDAAEQLLENEAGNKLIQSADTDAHGLFWMSDAVIAETVATIAAGGGTISKNLFTREILDEVYGGKTTIS
jgi:ABC-type nitrate/sulfonate/bicarbonate transport system substrate-binding protein